MITLAGKKALVLGIANNRSIAWAIAQAFHSAGAELAVNYLPDEKGRFEAKVRELTAPLAPAIFAPCDVRDDAQIAHLFETIASKWGRLDILVHCLAFGNKEDLQGPFTQIRRDGYSLAMEVSAFSLIALANRAVSLMPDGGSILTLTYIGSTRVMEGYGVMGPAKAALEANTRYLAAELGKQNVRVNAVSAGPIRTLAASGLGNIHEAIHKTEAASAIKRAVTQEEVANTALFLASDLASAITGQTIYVDCGFSIMGG
ncbi:enoyl-ACP reductase FabI [Gloeobacter kilaueensis]|uniref:Enoyl-[acyl-carrier-protein] reductase [NADH] n=1 Tax=Gloeobacter kilaueensis (strain ATCC BAA-2537 / CCAP 1431/1 / ULC 316 / JS1) TaxID=1183438 RepID=U5QFC1_GLOK1|nr:enoyl-ACP reductase FabI [Gloeobacter kilaueensis]AGY56360.1 enoyl-(acyl carrier protein) reductase [Gloeobacter kilaueensis JS1]